MSQSKSYHSRFRSWLLVPSAIFFTFLMILVATPVGLVAPLGRAMNAIERFWAWVLLKMARVQVAVQGAEHIRPDKTYIFICNHQSLFDIPLIMYYAPKQLRMIFKKELLWVPFFGFILWLLKFISIDRGNRENAVRSLHEAAKKIHDGINIVIYADGTRSVDGELKPFKKGAFILAIDAQVDVVPVTISGTINVVHKYALFDIRFDQEVALIFSEPISTSTYTIDQKDQLKDLVAIEITRQYEKVKSLSKIDDPAFLKKIQARQASARRPS